MSTPMAESIGNYKVGSVLRNPELSRRQRVDRLLILFGDARAEQRLASESMTVDNDGLNSDLRDIEMALQRLGVDPTTEEGRGAATL